MVALKIQRSRADYSKVFTAQYDRALVIDDVRPVRARHASIILHTVGAQLVHQSEDGDAALAALIAARDAGEPFDLLLADIATPGLTGVPLLEALQREGLSVKVLFVTGNPGCPAMEQIVSLGFEVLLKPLTPADLAAALRDPPASVRGLKVIDTSPQPSCRGPKGDTSANCLAYCSLAATDLADGSALTAEEPLCSPKIGGGVPVSDIPLFEDMA